MTSKEAIEQLKKATMFEPTLENRDYPEAFDLALKALKERPTGKWKITAGYPHKIYCDKCYKTYAQENWEVWKDGSLPRYFCPNCGAQMKGAKR